MAGSQNTRHLLKHRQLGGSCTAREFESKKHVTPEFIERLGLFKELEGHEGCVNCLEWNKSGDILASGSDDQTVILWQGETGSKLTQLSTDHQGNIFSVKFIPYTSDSIIVTGSQDSRVCMIDVEKKCSVQSAALSVGRVKRLAVSQETSGIFWSASEDGTVMQWDTREKWTEATTSILIDLNTYCARAEVKCIAVNPQRDNILAIGANDQFIRLYDRRKLKLKKMGSRVERMNSHRSAQSGCTAEPEDSLPTEAVKYFVPGHLAGMDVSRSTAKSFFRPLTTTYLNFSCSGNELVANMGGDHVYYFDRNSIFGNASLPTVMETLNVIKSCATSPSTPGTSSGLNGGVPGFASSLSIEVDAIKAMANAEFERGNYTEALRYYNDALLKESHPILYGNRAAAYMKRKFTGDIYAAHRDCITTLNMNPGHIKALLRLAKCLHELEKYEEADTCLEYFKSRYPDHGKSSVCIQLEKDIKAAQAERNDVRKTEEDNEKDEIQTTDEDTEMMTSTSSEELEPDTPPGAAASSPTSPPGPSTSRSSTREGRKPTSLSWQEIVWRQGAVDYTSRYVGACNTTTDIKEANFFGNDNQFITSGSDDGKIFIWDTKSTNLVKVLSADSSTVNCVQGHPGLPVLASSGIENVVRLWHPRPEDGQDEPREIKNLEKVIKDNQDRMGQDPFEYFISNDQIRDTVSNVQCRTS